MASRRTFATWMTSAAATLLVAAVATTTSPSVAAEPGGQLSVVHALPDADLVVTIDGREVADNAPSGDVVGPMHVSAGEHEVGFTSEDGSVKLTASVQVAEGTDNDVVVHRPAEVGGKAVVSVYETPIEPIGPGKARVLLAHTATTAPADVSVDGSVVFTNIANGEFAVADVAAGAHRVSLLPSGIEGDPILGPLDVKLAAGVVTTVYAVGNPRDGSMDVIVRETDLSSDGTEAPVSIETGSAGYAALVDVVTFRADR